MKELIYTTKIFQNIEFIWSDLSVFYIFQKVKRLDYVGLPNTSFLISILSDDY